MLPIRALIKKSLLAVVLTSVALGVSGCKKKEKEISIYDKTLVGIDKNNNHIRDEIEERMFKEFGSFITAEEQKVMDQNARVFDEILHLDLNNRDDVLLARDHLDLAINCGILVFGEDMRYHDFSINLTNLKQWYFNTKERKEHHYEFIIRSKEYHFQPTNFEGANTCDFEFSKELVQEIERRKAVKAERERLKAEKEKKANND
jgi:hypothetical protein